MKPGILTLVLFLREDGAAWVAGDWAAHERAVRLLLLRAYVLGAHVTST